MDNTHKSSSLEQQETEKHIFRIVEEILGVKLENNKKTVK